MKKIYALLILCCPLFAVAQITVTSADFPAAGTTTIMANDTTYHNPIAVGGANQQWDFSTLQNQQEDTTAFMNAAGTAYAGQFPSANLAVYGTANNGYSYYTSNANGFYFNGNTDGTVANTINFNPPLTYVPAPFTYQSIHNDFARIQVDSTVSFGTTTYDLRQESRFENTFEGDGYGSLQLPNHFYANALRIKITEWRYDSTLYAPTGTGNYSVLLASATKTVHYRFVISGQPCYVLGLEADSSGNFATSASYLVSATVGLTEHSVANQSLQIAPNPAKDKVHISLPHTMQMATLKITDEQGKAVEQINCNANDAWLDVSRYNAGWYLISAEFESQHYSAKLLVNRSGK